MDKNYFYVTIHFQPKYENIKLFKINDNIYKHKKTKIIYKKRLMYDWGWGQEYGFQSMPFLQFKEMIELITNYRKRLVNNRLHYMNLIGAVSVIMQDHIEEFIDFLTEKINTDFFSNPNVRENFKWFSFSTQKTKEIGKIPGGILTQSYEEVLNQYPEWREISSRVIELVYQ